MMRTETGTRLTAVLVTVVMLMALTIALAPSARAATGMGATVEFPTPVTVGDDDLPASIQFVNISNGAEASGNIAVSNPLLTPACVQPPTGSPCTSAEAGVFAPSSTGTGTGNWSGISFTIQPNGTPGSFEFVPDAPLFLGPLTSGASAVGGVDFTVDVLKVPDTDTQGGQDGVQTEQLVTAEAQHMDTGVNGGGFGRDTTTVNPATPAVVTTIHDANHDEVLVVEVGTTVHDSIVVSPVGVGPTPTGTANFDWRENFACSGDPVAVSGPVALTDGEADATGFTQTPTEPGGYSFRGHYSGDANYVAASSACEPLDVVDLSIEIANDDVNEVGDAHDFTITVTEHSQAGDDPVQGAAPTVSFPGTGAPGTVDDSDCADGTNASGQCTVTINSAATGTFTAVASVTHSVNGISMTRATDGNSGQVGNSEATKVYVDARIRVTPDGTNEVGDAHEFTVLVEADDGSGSGWSGVAGVTPSITVDPTPDSVDTSDCDAGTDVDGECTVVVNHNTPEHVEVDAAATFEIVTPEGAEEVTRNTAVNNGNVSTQVDPDVTGEKDWVDLSIAVVPDGLNEVGDAHVFTVTVTEHTPGGDAPAADGTPVSISWSPDAPASVDNGCADGTTDGTCTVTVNSPDAGTATINVSTTATVLGVELTRSTAANAGPQGSGPAAKRWVDGSIRITPDGVNEVNDPHTFTVSTLVDDGTGEGPVAPPDGTAVTVTVVAQGSTAPAQIVANDCGDNGTTDGSCTITINSATTGVYVVSASFSHTFTASEAEGDDVTISRTTDGTGANSGAVTKRYVDAVVRIDPDGVNLVDDPHTFAVEVLADLGDGQGWVAHAAAISVRLTDTDGASSVVDADGTTCGIDPDSAAAPEATCEVVFASSTTGFTIGHATATLDVLGVSLTRETDGTVVIDGDPNDDAVKEWVEVEVLPEVLEKTGVDSALLGLLAFMLIAGGAVGLRLSARRQE